MLYYTFTPGTDKCKDSLGQGEKYDLTGLNLKQAVFWIGEVYAIWSQNTNKPNWISVLVQTENSGEPK